jgi:hypothetical protein
MTERPRTPDDLPADHGHPGPAAAAPSPPPADNPRDVLAGRLASRWAVILRRFRDYMHQR